MGRLAGEGTGASPDREYRWSVDDRLMQATLAAPAATIHYSYDHLGTRTGRNAPDDDNRAFLTDYRNPTGYSQTLSEIDSEENVLRNTWWGDDHAPLAQSSFDPESPDFDLAFFHGDNLGTTRLLTGRSGSASNDSVYAYSPFGVLDATPTGRSLTDYYFTGQWKDGGTGLQYHRARWYRVNNGGWASQDPIRDFLNFLNLYSYVTSSSTGAIDPTGKSEFLEKLAVVAVQGYIVALRLAPAAPSALNFAWGFLSPDPMAPDLLPGAPGASLGKAGRQVANTILETLVRKTRGFAVVAAQERRNGAGIDMIARNTGEIGPKYLIIELKVSINRTFSNLLGQPQYGWQMSPNWIEFNLGRLRNVLRGKPESKIRTYENFTEAEVDYIKEQLFTDRVGKVLIGAQATEMETAAGQKLMNMNIYEFDVQFLEDVFTGKPDLVAPALKDTKVLWILDEMMDEGLFQGFFEP